MDKQICNKHIDDAYLRYYIRKNGERGICSYCKDERTRTVMEIDDLAEFVQSRIGFLFDDAVECLPYDSSEGGYQGTLYSTYEILSGELDMEMDEEVFDDLNDLIEDIAWCINPYADTESEILRYNWNDFKNFICHRQRYTIFQAKNTSDFSYSLKVSDILDEISKLIFDYKLLKKIPKGTSLCRCRQHDHNTYITDAEDICAPNNEHVLYSNRMSPAGISMFYCAFENDVAIRETVDFDDKHRSLYSIASFKLKQDISAIDLSELPQLPSIFNESKIKHYHPLLFLKNFVDDICQPVSKKSKGEKIDYIPTQGLIEYFKFILSPNKNTEINGLIYPSSIVAKKKSMVLFYDHEESLTKLKFLPRSVKTNAI